MDVVTGWERRAKQQPSFCFVCLARSLQGGGEEEEARVTSFISTEHVSVSVGVLASKRGVARCTVQSFCLHFCTRVRKKLRPAGLGKKGLPFSFFFFFFFWDIKRETDTHFFTRQNPKPRQTVRTGAELKKTYRVCVCSLQMRKELD